MDDLGGIYLCLLVDNGPEKLKYTCVPITRKRLSDFHKGLLDLRTIFVDPEVREFYVSEIDSFETLDHEISYLGGDPPPEHELPEGGFFLSQTESVNREEVLVKSKELYKPVFFASLNPPEAIYENKINTDTLSYFLGVLQSFIKHAYRKKCRGRSTNTLSLRREDAHKLQVFEFARGSFTVKFSAADSGNLLGECGLELSFEKLDELTSSLNDPQATLEILKENKGHIASSFISLLKFMDEQNTSIDYSWATPMLSESRSRSVRKDQAVPIIELYHQVSDISNEDLFLRGRMIHVHEKRNRWTLLNLEDNKEYSGTIKAGSTLSLRGIVISSVIYDCRCEEVIESISGSGRENKQVYLTEYSQYTS